MFNRLMKEYRKALNESSDNYSSILIEIKSRYSSIIDSGPIKILKTTWEDIKTSNNKVNKIIEQKNIISGVFGIATIIFGTIGYIIKGSNPFDALLGSIMMFGFNFPKDIGFNIFLILAVISTVITIFLVAVVFFIKDFFEKKVVNDRFKHEHSVVFGLGEVNRSFLNSIKDKREISTIVIVESDVRNIYIEEYKTKGFAVFISDVFNENGIDDLFNFDGMKNAIIALGNDRHNIEFSKVLIDKYNADSEIKLVVHIQNKELEILFHTSFINNEKKIQIKTFSFYEEVAKDLLNNHFIDGDSIQYINSNQGFKTIILGNNILLKKIIYQLALVSHFPNENKHTIFIVDKEADKLLLSLKKDLYYNGEIFPTLELKAVNLDAETVDFYNNTIWNMPNLENIIIGFDEEYRNLDTAVELYNRVYLSAAIKKKIMPKILFAIYDELLLSNIINKNRLEFDNFYTFGNANDVLNYTNLVDEESDLLAQFINYTYESFYKEEKYDPKKLIYFVHEQENKKMGKNASEDYIQLLDKWYSSPTYNDKMSSLAQSRHIDMKLKAIGLQKVRSKKNIKVKREVEELLSENWTIMDKYFKDDSFYEDLKDSGKYTFPERDEFDKMFNKLIRMEHNRWNAYHYLNGWKFEETKDKPIKIHNCLLPLEDFNASIQDTIRFDINSFMYLPNYLAEAGYIITKYNDK